MRQLRRLPGMANEDPSAADSCDHGRKAFSHQNAMIIRFATREGSWGAAILAALAGETPAPQAVGLFWAAEETLGRYFASGDA